MQLNSMETQQWVELQNIPLQCVTQLIATDRAELIAIPEQHYREIDGEEIQTGDGVYMYLRGYDRWIRIFEYPNKLLLGYHSATFDPKERIIWIVTAKQLLMFKLDELSLEIFINDLQLKEFPMSHICVVKGIVYIIDGNSHFILDKTAKKLNKMYQFTMLRNSNDFIGAHGNGLLYLKCSHSLMLLERRQNNIIMHEHGSKFKSS